MATTPSARLALVDTNLLLVLVVAAVEPDLVLTFKRTHTYSLDDVALLDEYLAGYEGLLLTPSILAEVSNLLGSGLSGARLRAARQALAALVARHSERYDPSSELVGREDFVRLGLTDVAIGRAAPDAAVVLTDDLDLYVALSTAGAPAVNFNHLRAAGWAR